MISTTCEEPPGEDSSQFLYRAPQGRLILCTVRNGTNRNNTDRFVALATVRGISPGGICKDELFELLFRYVLEESGINTETPTKGQEHFFTKCAFPERILPKKSFQGTSWPLDRLLLGISIP